MNDVNSYLVTAGRSYQLTQTVLHHSAEALFRTVKNRIASVCAYITGQPLTSVCLCVASYGGTDVTDREDYENAGRSACKRVTMKQS